MAEHFFWSRSSGCVTQAMKLRFMRRRHGQPIREAELLLAGDEAGASSPEANAGVDAV